MPKEGIVRLWILLDYSGGNPAQSLFYTIFPTGFRPGENWKVVSNDKLSKTSLITVTVISSRISDIRKVLTDEVLKPSFGIKDSGVVGKNGEHADWPKMGCN